VLPRQPQERNVFTATGKEIVPNGAATEYTPADAGSNGWSIMCKEQGKVDYVKYTFSDYSVKTHYSSPWFINGDGSGTWIDRLEFLSKVRCWSSVSIRVKFYTWERGDKYPCGSFKLKLKTPSCYYV
jgi:hypothetical protein